MTQFDEPLDESEPMTGGLWLNPQVPKRGWWCSHVNDLEDLRERCQMCGVKMIRYQHVMRHDDYEHEVLAGCVCAGRLEQDPEAAKQRERQARRASKLKSDFEPEWHWSSLNNNPWFKHRQWRVTVFPDKKITGGWKYVVSHGDDKPHFGRTVYPDQKLAMEAARLAYIEQVRANTK